MPNFHGKKFRLSTRSLANKAKLGNEWETDRIASRSNEENDIANWMNY